MQECQCQQTTRKK